MKNYIQYKKCAIFLSIAMLAAAVCIAGRGEVFASSDDRAELLLNRSSRVFSPGYFSAAKQKSDEIVSQANDNNGFVESTMDFIQRAVGAQVAESSKNDATLKLRGPQGALMDTGGKLQTAVNAGADNRPDNVKIGSGTEQQYAEGNLVAETIDGTRYNYAGFSSSSGDTIQAAVDRAGDGEVIIVKTDAANKQSGQYSSFAVGKAVKIYGGYDSNGKLSESASRVYGIIKFDGVDGSVYQAELSGFSVTSPSSGTIANILRAWAGGVLGSIIVNNSYSVNITNCTAVGYNGLLATNSTVAVSSSKIGGTLAGISAYNSHVTAVNNNIAGAGFWMYSTFFLIYLPNTGYGITGDNSTFSLTDNKITSASLASPMSLSNNSQALYIERPALTQGQDKTGLLLADNRPLDFGSRSYLPKETRESSDSLAIRLGEQYKNLDAYKLGEIFKGLLAKKYALPHSGALYADSDLLARIVGNPLEESALSTTAMGMDAAEVKIAALLADIIKNPDSEQKMMLDALASIINETQAGEAGPVNPELKEASDKLVQITAQVLLAQAMPGLINAEDMANIKTMFRELESIKDRLNLEYHQATKPYYEKMIDDLIRNMGILQSKNIISRELRKEDLQRLSRREIKELIERLKREPDKTFEIEYILQQESKYRQEYMDPNRKKFEEDMKHLLKDFTARIEKVLKNSAGD